MKQNNRILKVINQEVERATILTEVLLKKSFSLSKKYDGRVAPELIFASLKDIIDTEVVYSDLRRKLWGIINEVVFRTVLVLASLLLSIYILFKFLL